MLRAILAIFGIVASVASFALQNPPEEVFSAAAKWLRVLGLDQVPAWVADPRADWWLSVAFGAAALAAFATLAVLWLRKRRQAQVAAPHVLWLPDTPPPHPRDMTACEAVAYIGLKSSWGRKRGLGGLSFEAARELRQAAREGRLQVYGYQGRQWLPDKDDVVWSPIPPSDWNEHKLDLTECDNPKSGGGATEQVSDYGIHVTRYTHLMVSRAQVEQLWPR